MRRNMASITLRYDQLVEEAYRGVIRRVLNSVKTEGLPGAHHFFIAFKTHAPGVEIADFLRQRWPDEMTIVLQYQFWDLEVARDHFAVTLSFNEMPERLVVPYAAIVSFADPAAKFGLQFQQETGAAPDGDEAAPEPPAILATAKAAKRARGEAKREGLAPGKSETPGSTGAADTVSAPNAPPAEKVVTLDSFRRK